MLRFIIVSHRRSGTHFLWNALQSNFDIGKSETIEKDMGGFKWHRPHHKTPPDFIKDNNCIFLVRDPRDVLVSIWYYWYAGAESTLNMRRFLKVKTFSDYIRGCSEYEMRKFADFQIDDIDAGHYIDPVQHWATYTEWSNHIYTIKFEDLKQDYETVLTNFANEFKLEPKDPIFNKVDNLVGHKPRKGIVNNWKNFISKEDNEYIINKIGHVMAKFNYI